MSAQPPRPSRPNPPAGRPATPPGRTARPAAPTGRPAAPTGRPTSGATRARTSSRPVAPPSSGAPPWAALIGILLLVVAAGVFLWTTQSRPPAAATPVAGMPGSTAGAPGSDSAGATIEGEISVPFTTRNHTSDPVPYKEVPPMGGPHWDEWNNCGVYFQPLQNEQGVHSLEHGAVWITYRPDLPTDQVQALATLVRQSTYRLLSPYVDLPQPIVATAWGYQLALESAADPRLLQFVQRHEQDPAGPEAGAPCSGGVGSPTP